eukprot:38400-Prorocentrum_minimum.AAC.1
MKRWQSWDACSAVSSNWKWLSLREAGRAPVSGNGWKMWLTRWDAAQCGYSCPVDTTTGATKTTVRKPSTT